MDYLNDRRADVAREQVFSEIREALTKNICDYRQYIKLGEWYEEVNIDQAYLTYEQARYFLRRDGSAEDQRELMPGLDAKLTALKMDARNHVHPASIVVVSFNTLDLTKKCLESIRATCDPEAVEMVFVDNASHDGSREWLAEQEDIVFVASDHNAGFPGGCNLGFRAADPRNDMLLLNSDTEVLENSVYMLRMGLYSDRKIGMAGGFSNANYLGDLPEELEKIPRDEALYYEYGRNINVPGPDKICIRSLLFAFFVIVRRDVFNKVGEWDELYNPGNYDDHDYSYRILKAGYRNVICWNSFIIHRAHRSFRKNAVDHSGIMHVNFKKFSDKWGFTPDYYSNFHRDMLSLITHKKEESFRALFVGCGCGDALCLGEYRYPNARFSGIEKNPVIAKMGTAMADVISGDIETMELPYGERTFDYIFIAHTLEQIGEPEKILVKLKPYLAAGGKVICTLLNGLNARVIKDLLGGSFHAGDIGTTDIMDSRNINFFTLNDMRRLFVNTGYRVEFLFSMVLVELRTNNWDKFFGELCAIEGVVDRSQFNVHHYVFRLNAAED